MRIHLVWVIAFVAVSLAGVLLDTARAQPGASLQSALAPYGAQARRGPSRVSSPRDASLPGASPLDPSPLTAAIVLQAADCSGNFRMINLLHRHDVRSAVRLSVVWYAGAIGDSSSIRAALPAWTGSAALRPAPAHVLHELSRLGHRSTPVLVVLDADGRIRLTTQSPRSAREFAGLQRIITGLTWSEER